MDPVTADILQESVVTRGESIGLCGRTRQEEEDFFLMLWRGMGI
jgi:hypothetical protein